MTNTDALREAIAKSGRKLGYLAECCGITRQALSNKIKNLNFFTTKEIEILCKELDIKTLTERDRIFFAKKVE